MKIESTVINKKSIYEITTVLNNIGVANSIKGTSCLVNIKTHEFIGEFDEYHTTYYTDSLFYFQQKYVENPKTGTKSLSIVNIYDAKEEKYLAKNYILIEGNYPYSIYQDPDTKKYHIFDMKNIRNGINIFDQEFDSIKTILKEHYGTFTITEQNGKKGVYNGNITEQSFNIGTPIEHDNIYQINSEGVVVFVKGEDHFFKFYSAKKGEMVKSPNYKNIKCDKERKNILYCETENDIVIYDTKKDHRKLLCRIEKTDDIECIRESSGGRYIFKVNNKGKYGLYALDDDYRDFDNTNSPNIIKIANIIYDHIEAKNDNFYLYNGNKKGLYSLKGNKYNKQGCFIDAIYDDINSTRDYYLLFTGDKCDIITLNNVLFPLVKDCEIIECHDGNIIFKKEDKYGLLLNSSIGEYLKTGLDNVVYKGTLDYKHLFQIEKDEKQGLIYGSKCILEPKTKSIEFEKDGIKNITYYNHCFLSLRDEKVKLAKFYRKETYYPYELIIKDEEYDDIEFFDDIYVIRHQGKTYIYDYNEKHLKTFEGLPNISCINLSKSDMEIKVYSVEDEHYLYRSGNFELSFTEFYDVYVAYFETDKDIFRAETHAKNIYDKFCDFIGSQTDEEAEKSLLSMIYDKAKMNGQYPTLTLTQTSKRKDL